MRNRLHILFYLLIATILVGCGGEDYEWDRDNTSPLEGKYESRDKSLDLTLDQQKKIIESETQYALLSQKTAMGIIINVLFDDNTSISRSYGCETLKSDVINSGILTYATENENCEKNLLITNRMKLGSLTKTAVGRTILDIDNDTRYDFDLDDLITKHLPSNISSLGDLSGIRVKHLLFHTSGLGEIDFQPATVEEVLRKALALKKLGEPGQYYKYNNAGYVLLGEIIEYVTGSASWETEVMSRLNIVFNNKHDFILPERNNVDWLQTTDTAWMSGKVGTLLDGNNSLAVGYFLHEGIFISLSESPSPNIAHSAGSLIGTVPDVSRWMQELSTNRSGLLEQSYFNLEVIETHYEDDFISHKTWNMGPGLGFEQSENAFFHLGAVSGYNCMSVYSKNEKVTISACVNGSANLTDLPYNILAEMYPYRASYRTTSSH